MTLLYPIPPVIEKSTGTRHWEFETELLALAAAAEGLHRRCYPQPPSDYDPEAVRKAARKAARDAVSLEFSDQVGDRVYQCLNHFEDPTYRKRLTDLIQDTKEVVPGITGTTDDWIERVASVRNGYAHLLTDEPVTTIGMVQRQSKELIVLHESIRWLLVARLMLYISVESDHISEGLQGCALYRNFFQRAPGWLPDVHQNIVDRSELAE
jgi:hypothetical protein